MRHNPLIEIGRQNKENVRTMLTTFPGISGQEIAKKLDLSRMAVGRHIAAIRKEWGGPRRTRPRKKG